MTEETAPSESTNETPESATRPATRRRASRAAGPAAGKSATARPSAVALEKPSTAKTRGARSVAPPPRRQPHRALVAGIALGVTGVMVAALTAVVWVLLVQRNAYDAEQAREERFVDTAEQTVVNMFSYNQNDIDESVNRFVDGISGPLRDMMSQGDNVENLKAIFRDTNATSEVVVNGAALEGVVDDVARNAAVLVSVRVTVTDLDGVNAPSKPYRLRVIVHEDDNGHMTGYDLKYPDGGN
ncbi:MAG: mammalian cell entry protein [Mycobacterium sp.]